MTALSRTKGRRFELEVSRALAGLYPLARPNLAQSRGTSRDGPDVLGTPWWIECCHSAADSTDRKWAQAVHDVTRSENLYAGPVVITKRNRRSPIVTTWGTEIGLPHCPEAVRVSLSLDHWIALLTYRARLTACAEPWPAVAGSPDPTAC